VKRWPGLARGAEEWLRSYCETFSIFGAERSTITGGRLRIFDLDDEQSIEIEPTHDSLLVFPLSALHEVETISCPDDAFADGRFAVNIWLCG